MHIGNVHVLFDRNGITLEGHYWPFNNYWVDGHGNAYWYRWHELPFWQCFKPARYWYHLKPVDGYTVRGDHCLELNWSKRWPFITWHGY